MHFITLLWKPFLLTTFLLTAISAFQLLAVTFLWETELSLCHWKERSVPLPHPLFVYSPLLSNFLFREEQHLLKV